MAATLSWPDSVGDDMQAERDPVREMRSIILHLDSISPNVAFDQLQDIVSDSSSSEDEISLWESCLSQLLREVPSPNTDLLRIRVEYHLNTSSDAIVPLRKLVAAHKGKPDVLQEAAYTRYLLAEQTAKRWYYEEYEKLDDELDGAKYNLKSLMDTKGKTQKSGAWMAFGTSYVDKEGKPRTDLDQEITQAGRAVAAVESRLRRLKRKSYHQKYKEEVHEALKWALEAQDLVVDNPLLRELINEMQDELGVQPLVPDADIVAKIEVLVQEDELEEALTKLSSFEAYRHDAILLTRRLTRIRRQERQSTVTREEANAEYASIAEGVVDLISS